jgi:hypothetical protein
MNNNGLRRLLLYGLTRQQLIDFIKRKDTAYGIASFAWHTDEQLRQLAISVDKKVQADRQKNKNNKWTLKNEKQIRKDFIDYITANDKKYSEKNLKHYSVTALTIMKTVIEIRLYHARQSNKKK